MTRRDFAMRLVTIGSAGVLPACFLSNAYRNLEHYVPVALLAFDRIIDILVEHQADVSKLVYVIARVKAALADIQTAIMEWKVAKDELDRQTAIGLIRAALQVAQKSLDDFWRSLNLHPDLASTVHALLLVIISTLTAFESQLPGASTAQAGTMRLVAAPQLRTVKEFRRDFNNVLAQHGENRFAI